MYMEQDTEKHLYASGSTFERGLTLYVFDRQLRQLVFEALHDVEISLRTKVIQEFSMKYGSFWFLDASLFKDQGIFEKCAASIKKEVDRSNEDFIKDHKQKYSSPEFPPVWKTLEVVSFGTLSKLFCNFMDTETKKRVAKEFGLPQYVYLESWIRCAAVLRNFCAHHARIWNRRFPLKPKIPNRLPNRWIATQQKPQKLYHQLCSLLYMEQSVTPNSDLREKLLDLFKKYPELDFHAMGFPANWQEEPLWKD